MNPSLLSASLIATLVLASCASHKDTAVVEPPRGADVALAKPAATAPVVKKKKPTSKRYAGAGNGYRRNSQLWNKSTKTLKTDAPRRLVINTKTQRGRLYAGDQVVMDFPVTTGKAGKRTPKGTFSISEKIANKRSNLYGSFVKKDRVVRSGVHVGDKRPKGSSFKGAKMPYWMRFNGSVGIHAGPLRNSPSSNGCVRVPSSVAPVIYKNMAKGGKIVVQ